MSSTFVIKEAKVQKVIYHNTENGWGVFSIDNVLEDKERFPFNSVTVAGEFDHVYEDCLVDIEGEYFEHPKYGSQIKLLKYRVKEDHTSKEGIINFLTKSAIKGINIQNARKIYNKYKEKSIDIVLNEPLKLASIKGIAGKTVQKIKDSVNKYKERQELIQFCVDNKVSYSNCCRLEEELGKDVLNTLKSNPYIVLAKSDYFTFKQIDNIALNIGFDIYDKSRLKYGLLSVLRTAINLSGSTGYPVNKLLHKFNKELGVNNVSLFQEALVTLRDDKSVVIESDLVYDKNYYDAEKEIAEKIKEISARPILKGIFKKSIIDKECDIFDFKLTDEQKLAIKKCLLYNFSVLTASAGCGKSTITRVLVNVFLQHDYRVILLSPTGKATRRLEECADYPAQTIHKFLNVKHKLDDAETTDIGENAVIILDECSMVDIQLFKTLLRSINDTTKIILIGDSHQLPSVQAGNILGDLIDSKKVNICKLTQVMRQAQDSHILDYCNKVNSGQGIRECKEPDIFFSQFSSSEKIKDTLLTAYSREYRNRGGFSDLQVLTIYKKGAVGDTTLNKEIREIVNPYSEDLSTFGFMLHDKVMHTKNNYKKYVFNGETGIVSRVEDDTLYVQYDGRVVEYTSEDIDELQLAYSSTVHKSQGSEYKVTFVIVDNEVSSYLLNRKILYTAISRGKEKVYLLAKKGCVDACINNDYYEERYTKLKSFLTD